MAIRTDLENKSKRSFSNADLRPEGKPGTVYGEWTVTKDNRKKTKFDEMLEEGVTVDDILQDAIRQSRRPAPGLDEENRRQRILDAGKIQESYSPVREFVRGVRESPVAQGGLIAGSIIPSPLQPLFGAALTAESAADFADDPGIMSGMGAMLGAIPGFRAVRGAVRGRRAASEGQKVAEGLYRQTGVRRGTEVPYQAAPSKAQSGSVRGLLSADEPQVTRVPMNTMGDEYAAIREGGGPFSKNWKLDPEEAAAEDEFWESIAALMGR